MKCKNCGQENPRGAKYCGYCQKEVIKTQKTEVKKHSILILVSVVVACVVIGLILQIRLQSEHVHTWKPANCESPMTCVACGETSGIESHEWRAANCLVPRTCKLCGLTLGLKGAHSWETATENTLQKCRICGKTKGIALNDILELSVDDIITFGTYEQDGDWENDGEPMEWIVLDIQDNRALLLSWYALNSKPYNTDYEAVDWESCSLRQWLNDWFLKFSFSDAEKKAILSTTVNNSVLQGNQEWESTGGKNTQDQVFLLSYQEVMRYFGGAEDRICTVTPYAIEMGADTREYNGHITEAGWWWLRSPGEKEHHAAFINFDGNCYSNAVSNEYLSVRPAMWVDLEVLSTLDCEIFEDEDTLYVAAADAIRERLPIVTYAMTDAREVYSYSNEKLSTKTDWYYFYSRTNEIVIMDVSEDGKALYVRHPSIISETGYRDCWFAAKDILGDINLNMAVFSKAKTTEAYRIESGNILSTCDLVWEQTECQILGDHWMGNKLVIYPMKYKKTVLGIEVEERMALIDA